MSVTNEKGDPPLWLALENGLEDIASTLVRGEGKKKKLCMLTVGSVEQPRSCAKENVQQFAGYY